MTRTPYRPEAPLAGHRDASIGELLAAVHVWQDTARHYRRSGSPLAAAVAGAVVDELNAELDKRAALPTRVARRAVDYLAAFLAGVGIALLVGAMLLGLVDLARLGLEVLR